MKNTKIKVVILCAGKGSRLLPITNKIPKVLIEINKKTLLEYKLEILCDITDEVILIIGYKGDLIKKKYGNYYKNIFLRYVYQKQLLGSGHALMQARKYLNGKFLILNGDDIYSKIDIKKLLKYKYCILAKKIENPISFGVLSINNNILIEIIEKPTKPKSNLVNIGCYLLDENIFKFELKKSDNGEFEIIDYLNYLILKNEKIYVEKTEELWFPINNFDQLKYANKYLGDKLKCVEL